MGKEEFMADEVSCFTCSVGDVSCEYVECDDASEDVIDNYDEYERYEHCGKYDPQGLGKCKCCDKQLDGFMKSWRWWYDAGECGYPICKDCYDNVSEEELKLNLVCSC